MMGATRSSKNRTLLALMALLLASSGPASAQGSASASPGASQYTGPHRGDLDTADIPPAITENAADGAGPVNEAMANGDVPSNADPDVASASANPAGEGMTALPETGGVPSPVLVVALCAGISSLGCSLLLVRSSLRRR